MEIAPPVSEEDPPACKSIDPATSNANPDFDLIFFPAKLENPVCKTILPDGFATIA